MAAHNALIQAVIRSTEIVASDVKLFAVEPIGRPAMPFSVGSHLDVQVLVGNRPEYRSFSLVGQEVDRNCYRIAVKDRPDGRGGSRYLWSLEAGARLMISRPKDRFPLSYRAPEVLLVAGGIGITPLYGMALALAAKQVRLRLLYAAHSVAQLAFVSELRAALDSRLQLFAGDRGERIDPAGEIARLGADAELYVCGPQGLREDFQRAWTAAGRPPTMFRFETFASGGRFPEEPFGVEVANHGTRFLVERGQSLLQALQRHGVDDVLHDCERGECGLCAVKVVRCTGRIDHRDVFYSQRQRNSNDRLCACVSRVVGGDLVIDTSCQPVDTGEPST